VTFERIAENDWLEAVVVLPETAELDIPEVAA
jgi:hypothetical protein